MFKASKSLARGSAIATLALGVLGYGSAASACGESAIHAAAWDSQAGASSLFHQASQDSPGNHAIVGMWAFTMAASGFSDFGYQQWHSDGTEFMNSGTRAPATQNFCLGVWTQTGPSRYHLNHFALSYDNSGAINAKINIKEDVTLDKSGTTYTGMFYIDAYDPTSGARMGPEISGQVRATRVPAN
jgi:hypothetical protein